MVDGKIRYSDIDHYILSFPEDIASRLSAIRQCVREQAPAAEEVISYNMPAFKQGRILVYFAAFKDHIGFYALPSGNKAFQKELSAYKTGKGSIRFPLDEPLPIPLIAKIVNFRLKEIL